ncbi:lamin tail domain-containing protein [Metabacillus fastidiosus]|uniref:lamin tail domain-containing protein n=1 Tax=Metabacillus fastidiosus TaxID=1458 RepID=UPI003D2B3E5C
MITASTTATEPGNPSNNLFFSEYIEGSSYNKALEIYNGTGSSINLANYTIQSSNTPSIIQLSGTLAAGDVFVIANPNAASAILTQADMTSSNMEFNGDDSVTLKHNGTIIDVIGNAGVNFGKDKTLVRKNTVTAGTSTYNATEWNSFVRDTFTYLGSH